MESFVAGLVSRFLFPCPEEYLHASKRLEHRGESSKPAPVWFLHSVNLVEFVLIDGALLSVM